MFILYAVLIGVILGVVLGGDVRRLSTVSFHWKPLVIGGLIFQVVLFAPAVSDRVGDLGPWLYVGSTLAVLATVIRNARIPGLPIVIAGGLSNFAAIVANGGYMPADPAAMASLGKVAPETYSNSALLLAPKLQPLTDIFALPRWLPLANVFSIGDVIIAVGVAWAIVAIMRSGRMTPDFVRESELIPLARLRHVAGVAPVQPSLVTHTESTDGSFAQWDSRRSVPIEEHQFLHWQTPSRANPS